MGDLKWAAFYYATVVVYEFMKHKKMHATFCSEGVRGHSGFRIIRYPDYLLNSGPPRSGSQDPGSGTLLPLCHLNLESRK
jgi:hypothetical protein